MNVDSASAQNTVVALHPSFLRFMSYTKEAAIGILINCILVNNLHVGITPSGTTIKILSLRCTHTLEIDVDS